jgi:hypothetical protein
LFRLAGSFDLLWAAPAPAAAGRAADDAAPALTLR